MNKAVPFAAQAVFVHQGQVCVAASRLYVQAGIYDQFVQKAVEVAKSWRVGSPLHATTQNGPQVLLFLYFSS